MCIHVEETPSIKEDVHNVTECLNCSKLQQALEELQATNRTLHKQCDALSMENTEQTQILQELFEQQQKDHMSRVREQEQHSKRVTYLRSIMDTNSAKHFREKVILEQKLKQYERRLLCKDTSASGTTHVESPSVNVKSHLYMKDLQEQIMKAKNGDYDGEKALRQAFEEIAENLGVVGSLMEEEMENIEMDAHQTLRDKDNLIQKLEERVEELEQMIENLTVTENKGSNIVKKEAASEKTDEDKITKNKESTRDDSRPNPGTQEVQMLADSTDDCSTWAFDHALNIVDTRSGAIKADCTWYHRMQHHSMLKDSLIRLTIFRYMSAGTKRKVDQSSHEDDHEDPAKKVKLSVEVAALSDDGLLDKPVDLSAPTTSDQPPVTGAVHPSFTQELSTSTRFPISRVDQSPSVLPITPLDAQLYFQKQQFYFATFSRALYLMAVNCEGFLTYHPVGIVNCGLTFCYLNSVVQALSNVPLFALGAVCMGYYQKGTLFDALSQTYKYLWRRVSDTENTNPTQLLYAEEIRNYYAENRRDKFDPARQHDADEFLGDVIETLEVEATLNCGEGPNQISSLFRGYIRSPDGSEESFLTLRLSIADERIDSIRNALLYHLLIDKPPRLAQPVSRFPLNVGFPKTSTTYSASTKPFSNSSSSFANPQRFDSTSSIPMTTAAGSDSTVDEKKSEPPKECSTTVSQPESQVESLAQTTVYIKGPYTSTQLTLPGNFDRSELEKFFPGDVISLTPILEDGASVDKCKDFKPVQMSTTETKPFATSLCSRPPLNGSEKQVDQNVKMRESVADRNTVITSVSKTVAPPQSLAPVTNLSTSAPLDMTSDTIGSYSHKKFGTGVGSTKNVDNKENLNSEKIAKSSNTALDIYDRIRQCMQFDDEEESTFQQYDETNSSNAKNYNMELDIFGGIHKYREYNDDSDEEKSTSQQNAETNSSNIETDIRDTKLGADSAHSDFSFDNIIPKNYRKILIPQLLCVSLDRHNFDLSFNMKVLPAEDLVIPAEVLAPEGATKPAIYKLMSIVQYVRTGPASGHYYTYVKVGRYHGFKLNDSIVTVVDDEQFDLIADGGRSVIFVYAKQPDQVLLGLDPRFTGL